MAALDFRSQPVDRTAAVRASNITNRLDEEDLKRTIAAEALARSRAEEVRRQAEEERQKAQEARVTQEQGTKAQLPIAATDIIQWQGDPNYQKPFHQLPEEARRHFIDSRTYAPEVSATIPEQWNRSLSDTTGKIPGLDESVELKGIHVGDNGKSTRTYGPRTPAEGLVFKTPAEAEAAGYNPEGGDVLADGSIRITKMARNDISRRKLGVNEKNALTGAVTAASSLDNIEKDFATLYDKGKVGPIAGRYQEAKQALGIGDKEFSEFSAQTSGNLFNLARSLQGAGVLTEKDIQRMEQIVPTGKMAKDQFNGQLAGVRSLMAEKLKAWKIVNDESLSDDQRAQVDGILSRIQQGAGLSAVTPKVDSAAPVAPAKPKQVRQNGQIYTLQENGEYK